MKTAGTGYGIQFGAVGAVAVFALSGCMVVSWRSPAAPPTQRETSENRSAPDRHVSLDPSCTCGPALRVTLFVTVPVALVCVERCDS